MYAGLYLMLVFMYICINNAPIHKVSPLISLKMLCNYNHDIKTQNVPQLTTADPAAEELMLLMYKVLWLICEMLALPVSLILHLD